MITHPKLGTIIPHLRPDARPRLDYLIASDKDESGNRVTRLVRWNEAKLGAAPTQAAVNAAEAVAEFQGSEKQRVKNEAKATRQALALKLKGAGNGNLSNPERDQLLAAILVALEDLAL